MSACIGNERLRVLPVWELKFGNMPDSSYAIATEKVKHDPIYQKRIGIEDGPAKDLSPELHARIQRMAKRVYRTLEMDGYGRIDFRLSADGTPYFLEANPNPEIAQSQEFATAAKHDGLEYRDLLHRIVALGDEPDDAGPGHRLTATPPCGSTGTRPCARAPSGCSRSSWRRTAAHSLRRGCRNPARR